MTLFFPSSSPRGPIQEEVLPGRTPLQRRNTQLIETPATWLADKAADDQRRTGVTPGLWCVHGKLYDLSSFMARHPGGQEWLSMTRGSDITELVETHHLNMPAVEAVLTKTFVKEAPRAALAKAEPRFTFEPNGFYKTLQRRVVAVVGTDMAQHGPTSEMLAVCTTLLLCWALAFGAMCVAPMATAAIASIVAAFLLHGLMGVGHNFFHQADNLWMYAFDLSLFTSHGWRVSHAISHHTYANLEIDTEVSSVEPFLCVVLFVCCCPCGYGRGRGSGSGCGCVGVGRCLLLPCVLVVVRGKRGGGGGGRDAPGVAVTCVCTVRMPMSSHPGTS